MNKKAEQPFAVPPFYSFQSPSAQTAITVTAQSVNSAAALYHGPLRFQSY